MKKSDIPFGTQLSPDQGRLPEQLESNEPPLPVILAGVRSSKPLARARALELLALRLARLMDLRFDAWIGKSSNSKREEALAIATGTGLPINRWVIQCLDRRKANAGEIATAIGLAYSSMPNVVLSATTGRFTDQAIYYASKVMRESNLQILLISDSDLDPASATDNLLRLALEREARRAASIKETQLVSLRT